MTAQKSLKRRVRARMCKTGEHYTAARRQLLAKAPTEGEPTAPPTPFRGEKPSSDAALASRTGRTWSEWFELLEAWGATDRPHPEIAQWLKSEHGVNGWWSQELTVGYEMAVGRRRPGERPDGFSITASKTVGAPVERLFEAFVDDAQRARWLPEVSLRVRTATPYRTARFDWEDGSSRLAIGFTSKGNARSAVAVAHERLPDADTAEREKSLWRQRLLALQRILEG